MISHVKSPVALALAVITVAGAGLWFNNRTGIYNSLKKEQRDLVAQSAEAKDTLVAISSLDKRLQTLQKELSETTARFGEKDNTGPRLVTAVVKAAAASGMEMTAAAETSSGSSKPTTVPGVKMVSYQFALRGPYSALVKFMQNLETWQLARKIESLDITPAEDELSKGQVRTALVLSLFSCDRPDASDKQMTEP
jgi:hypothetical protein